MYYFVTILRVFMSIFYSHLIIIYSLFVIDMRLTCLFINKRILFGRSPRDIKNRHIVSVIFNVNIRLYILICDELLFTFRSQCRFSLLLPR